VTSFHIHHCLHLSIYCPVPWNYKLPHTRAHAYTHRLNQSKAVAQHSSQNSSIVQAQIMIDSWLVVVDIVCDPPRTEAFGGRDTPEPAGRDYSAVHNHIPHTILGTRRARNGAVRKGEEKKREGRAEGKGRGGRMNPHTW